MATKFLVKNKILTIGRRDVGKLALIKQLLNACSLPIPSSLPSLTDPAGHAGLSVSWRIDTKYYSADVQFWIDETADGDAGAEAMRQYEDEANGIGDVVDAVVFVFRKDRPETFKDLEQWVPFMHKHEPAIALCVGMSKELTGKESGVKAEEEKVQRATSEGREDKVEDYEGWCLENGFEYIDLDEKETADEIDNEDSHTEQVGLARVLEALQSNMWDGMTRKAVASEDTVRLQHIQHELGEREGKEEVVVVVEDEEQKEELKRRQRSGAPSPVPVAVREEEEEEEEDKEFYEALARMKVKDNVEESMQEVTIKRENASDYQKSGKDVFSLEDNEVDFDDIDMPSQTEVNQIHNEIFGDFEGEDGLNKAFLTLQALKAKGQTMSDADRRALAAKVALSFAAQFEL